MTNKILGLSVLVALVGALAALTPLLYRTLLSHESNVVYALEQQLQIRAADDPMKHFSGADWSLKVNIKGLSPQSAPVTTVHLYGSAGSGFSDTSTLSYTGNHFALFAVNGNVIQIGDQYQVCVDQNDNSDQRCQTLVHNAGDESLDVSSVS